MKKIGLALLCLAVAAGMTFAAGQEGAVFVKGMKYDPTPKDNVQPFVKSSGKNWILEESFEDVAFPPAGWRVVNVLGGYTWGRSTAQSHTGTASAFINYDGTGGEDWLITPAVTPFFADDSLVFWLRNQFPSPYPPDSILIKTSNTDSAIGSFTNTLMAIDGANLPYAWTRFSVSLQGLVGQRIFIAFQHKDTDGNGCYLDDVMIGNSVAAGAGDYVSVANGNWRTLATWATWDGSTWATPARTPGPGNNVLIRNGHTVTFAASPDTCRNLTVEAGGLLYCNSTDNRYLHVFGDNVLNDGAIGGPTDGLCFQFYNSVEISGTGTYQLQRTRAGQPGILINFPRNYELHYNGAALYSNNNAGVTYSVGNGDTLTFSGGAYFSFSTSSTSPSWVGGTFNIYGAVLAAPNTVFNMAVHSGLSSTLQVYGDLVLGGNLLADNDTTTGYETVIVNGAITYASADTQKFDHLYTNNGTGVSFGFPVRVNNNLTVGWGDYDISSGLTLANGATVTRYTGALTNTPVYEGWFDLQYGPNPEAAALTTGYEVPAGATNISTVTFANPAGVVLDKDLTSYGFLEFQDGIVTTGDYVLAAYNQPGRTNGHVDGTLGLYVAVGNPTPYYHVGTANGYTPVSFTYHNVTVAGGVGVKAVQGTSPNVNIPANTMQRHWDIGMDPSMQAVFDSCRINFTYLPADFNTGLVEATDEGTMIVGKGDSTGWTFPEISVRNTGGAADGGSIEIANVTGFSEFVIGKDQSAFVDIGPEITVVTHPEDTYDGAGPFIVRAVITDPGKSVVADTLWYTDNTSSWWFRNHASVNADTFEYQILGPFTPGTTIEYFIGAWDNGGNVAYDPGMYRGHQFRILDPLPPCSLTATSGDNQVQLDWEPPNQKLAYDDGTPVFGFGWDPGNIFTTRFSPQHYPCKVESAESRWTSMAGMGTDSVEIHVWPDDGAGIPNTSVNLIPSFKILPDTSGWTNIDLSGYGLIIGTGDFHIGYVCLTYSKPCPYSDGNGPGLRTMRYSSSGWNNLTIGNNYYDFMNRAVVSYSSYFKDQVPGKSLVETYHVFRSDVGGGPYGLLGNANGLAYTDNAVIGGNTYYYVVRAQYISPDAFSAYSNEASATPTGVEGGPGTELPTVFSLANNYPNPVRTNTTIKFGLPKESQVRVEVYNVAGQRVKTLANGKLNAGYHQITWKGANDNGQKVAAGVYLVRMVTPEFNATRKMTVIR